MRSGMRFLRRAPGFRRTHRKGKRRIPRKGALSMRERRDTPRPVRPEPPVISGLPSQSTERQELPKASPEELRQELGRGLQMVVGLTDNTPFGQGELASLQAQILTLSSQVAELGKQSREQTEVVQAMLSDMSESSERLGRKDWVLVAIGAGVSLVITGLVPPLVMLKLAVAAIHDLGHLLGLGGAQQAFIGS